MTSIKHLHVYLNIMSCVLWLTDLGITPSAFLTLRHLRLTHAENIYIQFENGLYLI